MIHFFFLKSQILQLLNPQDGQVFIDMTFGDGGHTKLLLSTGKDIRIIAMDRDPISFQKAYEMSLLTFGQVFPLLAKFSEMPVLLEKYKIKKESINGAIMDLGPSQSQLNDPNRGFWYNRDGPLDMRMDGDRFSNSIKADDVINSLDANYLARIFKIYGEEKYSKKYANAIIDSRFMLKRISTTFELAKLVSTLNNEAIFDDKPQSFKSASKVFQALRMFVNNEINEVNYAILKIREFLCLSHSISKEMTHSIETIKLTENEVQASDTGKLIVLSSNSVEDKLVKKHFQSVCLDDPLTQTQFQKLKSNLNLPTPQEMDQYMNKKWIAFYKSTYNLNQDFLNFNSVKLPKKLRLGLRIT